MSLLIAAASVLLGACSTFPTNSVKALLWDSNHNVNLSTAALKYNGKTNNTGA